ncbi:hypothetical protein SCE1572_42190 [Sorangium cellulosum So0157-2]|uniref:Uncharacterized protein n=1 Tax=Sorangium cellulosum So0157-2 TaxID=1254432 RepID=S4YCK0_SORCE|nr:hypothetical protein SCE1572_42190 [Sorangium cellulosum So0157-2]
MDLRPPRLRRCAATALVIERAVASAPGEG